MENAAKALEMAAGVLLGIMIAALVAYFFTKIRSMPENENEILTAEQLAKFNLEYEVYDKKGMYGVDVISCLNKAISNNRKYVEGGANFTGSKYGEKYLIDVCVKINTPLTENLRYYTIVNGIERESFLSHADINTSIQPKLGQVGFVFSSDYTRFTEDSYLSHDSNELTSAYNDSGHSYMDADHQYNLLDDRAPLMDLLGFSGNDMKQTVKNTDSNTLNIWSSAVWETALYDFKKKKFKCTDMTYSTETGRVVSITFEEI